MTDQEASPMTTDVSDSEHEDELAVDDHGLEPGDDEALAARRLRFRNAIQDIAERATSNDLVRWMLIPASVIVIVGFNFMIWGWVGAARTFREIEQIPYLISGGLIGLALVFLGGLMLAATFSVVVMRKFQDEAEARSREQLDTVTARLAELETTLTSVERNGTHPASAAPEKTGKKGSGSKSAAKRAKPRSKKARVSSEG